MYASRRGKLVLLVALVAAAFVHAASASADEIAPLEDPGTVALGFGANVGESHGTQTIADGTNASVDVTQLVGGVRAEVFVTRVVTLGGAVDAGWTHISMSGNGAGSAHALFVSPTARLGVYAPLSDHVGFWPYVFGGAIHSDTNAGDPADAWTVGGSARFVLRFDDRWFLAAEPIQLGYTTSSGASGSGVIGPVLRSGLSLGVAL